jgi:hypothetical protein
MVPRAWQEAHGLGDLNMTNKTNKPPSFIDRFLNNKNVWFMK